MTRPIYDPLDRFYKSTTGAVPTNVSTKFTLLLPKETGSTWVNFCVRTDDSIEKTPMENVGEDSQAYIWSCSFIPKEAGVFAYFFEAEGAWVPAIIKMDNNLKGSFDYSHAEFQLTVYNQGYNTPDWLKGGIMYQIFPDRFCRSGRPIQHMEERVVRDDWGGMPEWRPDDGGRIRNNDYFCGDLKGITQKLPYLKSMGVTCLYMNPIFYAGSNHRYDTSDYMRIDPYLGDEEDLKELCSKAGQAGINIILDGVFSHTGDNSVYFNKYGKFPGEGAYQSSTSPYREWYTFNNDGTYRSWWGIDTLPEVTETSPEYMDFICGDHGVIEKWMDCGIKGWRLDVADELPDKFIEGLRKKVKSKNPQALVLGEVWEDATTKRGFGQLRKYLWGDQLDSVMNYPFKEAVMNFISSADGDGFLRSVGMIIDHYPKSALDVTMNFLSTHDVERAITRLGGKPIFHGTKEEQADGTLTYEEYTNGKEKLKAAFAILFFLPGVPCIYYGDEIGMSGYRDPFNRRCMDWEKPDMDLLGFVTELCKIRNGHTQFSEGSCRMSFKNNILRIHRENILVAINVGQSASDICDEGEVLMGSRLMGRYGFVLIEE